MNTYAHTPISGSAMSNTSHHFSRTFMTSRGYARAATVRANSRQPVDRTSACGRLTVDCGLSTIVCRLPMFDLLHTSSYEIDEHIFERRLPLAQRDQSDLPRLQ